MQRLALAALTLTVVTLPFSGEPAQAREGDREETVWAQVLTGGDGRLLSATGADRAGVPLGLTTELETLGDAVVLRTTFRRGGDVLEIERISLGDNGFELICTAGEESLSVSLMSDDLTGETLVLYRLPDGEVFNLRFSEGGEPLGGNLSGLRRSLRRPMEVTRLMRSFQEHRKPLDRMLPSAGEGLIMLEIICTHACSTGCAQQCAFECALFGATGCQICWTACQIGCAIGCNS